MRVFVAYGYLPEELWIEKLAIPLLDQMGLTLIDGREIPGRPITQEVRRMIESADALIGFLTQRRPKGRGTQRTTSDYVRQEIEIALGKHMDVIQVVEQGVRPPGGMLAELQRITFKRSERDQLLVKLSGHVRQWIQGEMKVRLLPEALAEAVARDVRQAECRYRIIQETRTARQGVAELIPDGGGIFAKVLGFQPGTEVQVEVTTPQGRWSSRVVPHASPFALIELMKST